MKRESIQTNITEKLRLGQYKEVVVEERDNPHGWQVCSQVHANEIAREARFKSTLPTADKDLIVALHTGTGKFAALELFPDTPELDLEHGGTRAAAPESIAGQRSELQARRLHKAHSWCSRTIKDVNEGKIRHCEELMKSLPSDVDPQLAMSLLSDACDPRVMQVRSDLGVYTTGGKQLQVKKLGSNKSYRVWADVRAADKDARPNGAVVAKVDQSLVTDPDTPLVLRSRERLRFLLQTRDNSRSLATLLRASICGVPAELEVRLDYLVEERRSEVIINKVLNESAIQKAEASALRDLFPTDELEGAQAPAVAVVA